MARLKARLVSLLMTLMALVALAPAQTYTPKAGETVLKLVIAERGNIFVTLYTKEAPKTTARLLELVKSGFYAGQRFHKVVRTPRPFIAQVGDPNSIKLAPDDPLLGSTGTGIRIPYEETHHTHDEGAVSLATLGTDKDSGDCQFFFVLGAAHFLDGHYTVFGKVVAGLDVMRALQRGDHVQTATILKG